MNRNGLTCGKINNKQKLYVIYKKQGKPINLPQTPLLGHPIIRMFINSKLVILCTIYCLCQLSSLITADIT